MIRAIPLLALLSLAACQPEAPVAAGGATIAPAHHGRYAGPALAQSPRFCGNQTDIPLTITLTAAGVELRVGAATLPPIRVSTTANSFQGDFSDSNGGQVFAVQGRMLEADGGMAVLTEGRRSRCVREGVLRRQA
jgi:hypothetical protein